MDVVRTAVSLMALEDKDTKDNSPKANMKKAVRIFAKEFGMDRKASKLYDVFKSGPMKKIAKYGGLPKPTGCV